MQCAAPLPRQGAFRCFASLGANDEGIRKRIIEMDGLMEEVLAGLGDPCADVSNIFKSIYLCVGKPGISTYRKLLSLCVNTHRNFKLH